MNRTETRRSKQRQTSRPSNLLNETENAFIHQNLQNRQIAQATAVVELLEEDRTRWHRIGTGGLCFIKDSHRRSYFLNFFQIQQEKHKPIWEQEIYESINAINQRPFFIQFSANERQIGLNFADQGEAQEVFNLIKEKSKPKPSKTNSQLTVKPLQPHNHQHNQRMTNQHQTGSLVATQEPIPQKQPPNKKSGGIDKSMIGAPTDFRHIEGAKIGASGRMEKVQADIRQNDDMKKLLMDMKLIDSEHMFNKILEDDNVKNQIYGYIESVGGIKRARQSIRQPPPQQPRVPMAPPMMTHGMPPPPPPVNEHRTIHNQNQPPRPPNRRESIRETTKPTHLNSNRPAPPPPPVGKPDSGRPRAPPPSSGRPNMPPPPPKPTQNRPPPPPSGNLGGPPGPPPPPPPGPPPPSGPPPPINNFPPPPSTGGHQPPPPPLKPVKRENPLGDSKSALNAAINAGGFKLKPVDHSIDHDKQSSTSDNSDSIHATLAGMLQNIRKDIAPDDDRAADSDEWSD